jgi:acyl carrier protein
MEATLQIKDQIRTFIVETTYVDKSKIKDETMLFKDGYFDSMGFVSLISFLEEKFSIQTSDQDLVEENFESVNAITDFIQKKGAKAA